MTFMTFIPAAGCGRTPERLLTGLTMELDVIGRDDQIELDEGELQCPSSSLFARVMIDDGLRHDLMDDGLGPFSVLYIFREMFCCFPITTAPTRSSIFLHYY